ncbi:MAG: hypothetical protein AAF225_13105 [Pseudomonadota bacterium]
MFHMLSCFSLIEGVKVSEFRDAIDAFNNHMIDASFVCSVSPIGRRCASTPMDTDEMRDHAFFFTSTFQDRAQCDAAYAYILEARSSISDIHDAVMSKVRDDAVFICWEDI